MAKENQQALTVDGVSDGVMKRVYLDEPFSLAVHGGSGSGALTYQVLSGTDVATVQKHSGLLTIEKAGTAVIQVTKQTDEQYQMTSTRFSLQVAKAPGSLAISCDDLSYGAVPQAQICSQQGNGPVQYYYRGVGDTVYEESANAPLNAGSYEVYAINWVFLGEGKSAGAYR